MERESTPVISALKCRQRTSVPRVAETWEGGSIPAAHSPCVCPAACTAICIIFTLPPSATRVNFANSRYMRANARDDAAAVSSCGADRVVSSREYLAEFRVDSPVSSTRATALGPIFESREEESRRFERCIEIPRPPLHLERAFPTRDFGLALTLQIPSSLAERPMKNLET